MDRQRFANLWTRCAAASGNGAGDCWPQVYEAIRGYYGEPHRRYHAGGHIDHCLDQLDLFVPVSDAGDAVELALWFHDVIYELGARDNERRSAEWFAECARGVLATSMIDDVVRMIMATEHRKPPAEFDEKLVVDIDLSSFGLPWPEFLRDGKAVRAEASHLDDATFNRNHVMFMRSLLDRERIYSTDFFHDRYERSARYNMARKIRLMAELPSAAC